MRGLKHLVSAAAVGAFTFANLGAASAVEVHKVPRDFASIQGAVDAASPGDIIQVKAGIYEENVEITTPGIRLLGAQAVLDGSGLSGFGIHVLDTEGVQIQGFTVQHFEAGIVVENSEGVQLHRNELLENFSDIATRRDGIQLLNAHDSLITGNYAHDNGHNGITLRDGSSGNTLRGNRSSDNGLQVMANFGGCGIQLIGANNDDNFIAANETLRNGWGIQVGGGSDDNTVVQNRSHEIARAGVVVLDDGQGNFIGQNNARGNGLANVAPSGTFDLFDQGVLDNTWRNNKGSFNF